MIIIFEIYSNDQFEELNKVLEDEELPDVYYLPEFLKLCEISDGGTSKYAVFKDENNFWLYPFVERSIGEEVEFLDDSFHGKDVFSPYGYSGPVNLKSTNNVEKSYKKFREKLENYFRKDNIISEFVRFHPLLNNAQYFEDENLEKTGKVAYFNLNKSKDKLKDEFSSNTKRNIKKAKRNELKLEYDFSLDTIDNFYDIYTKTMERVGAASSYFFSNKYFNYIRKELKKNSFIVNVIYKDKVIASGLFFINNGIVQYHLGGSISEYLEYRPNDLLFSQLALWAKEQNYKYFNLGGGVGGKEDSLFRFKKSLAKSVSEFYTGRKIICNDKYNDLKEKWVANNPDEDLNKSDFFPIYRR